VICKRDTYRIQQGFITTLSHFSAIDIAQRAPIAEEYRGDRVAFGFRTAERRNAMDGGTLRIVCVASGFMMVFLSAGWGDAQTIKRETAPRIASVRGVDTYKAYCASCHGPSAKGDGPAAAALKTPPADLTSIAKRNGGRFSATDVEAAIMGRQVLAAHGSREMPIWGPVFQALASDDTEVKLRTANLVNYLKSIQIQ